MKKHRLITLLVAAILLATQLGAQALTLAAATNEGTGVFDGGGGATVAFDEAPAGGGGAPQEIVQADAQIRNIAKNRAVWHSSSANYFNTGHLVTDGIFKTSAGSIDPVVSQQWSDSPVAEEVQYAFDGQAGTKYLAFHPLTWVQYEFAAGAKQAVNGYTITTGNDQPSRDPRSWILYGVNDDGTLTQVDQRTGQGTTSNGLTSSRGQTTSMYTFTNATAYKAYRFEVTQNNGNTQTNNVNNEIGMIQFAELTLYVNSVSVIETPKQSFDSSWQSSGAGNQYVYVDLGGESTFDQVFLYWDTTNYATSFQIQVSDDATDWSKIVYTTTTGAGGSPQAVTFAETTARYIRLYCTASQGTAYKLYEFEVFGSNDVYVTPKALPPEEPDGRQRLTGGNWKLQRASEVYATGEQLSAAFDDSNWVVATVPGTALTSYLNNGSIPDPNYADWQFQISDSFFTADFWYRDSFVIPTAKSGQKVWLNFNNINWKADVFFNGENIGRIEGAFIRGKFDITDLVKFGQDNFLAVYIYKNDNPGAVDPHSQSSAGSNGGVLGTDNPTIHPSIGWDWVPTIRGRNIGIYGDTFISYSGGVQLADPWIKTNLSGVGGSTAADAAIDTSKATLSFNTGVNNPTGAAINATVKIKILPFDLEFSQNVTVPANGSSNVTIPFEINNPTLWWPNRYGDQFLHTCETTVEVGGVVSDATTFKFGIRELRWTTSGVFKLYVNGARIYCTGGNWGMDESMLRLDAEGYDIRVRLHKEAGFTMIRNWVGQTGNEEFYNACDKYGILIFDDFWLANPSDGPNPRDNAMFMANANDKIMWARKHPSLAFYCGRNEGQPPGGTSNTGSGTSLTPPTNLNTALREAVRDLDGTRMYVADSAAASEGVTLSGHGPYTAQGPSYYFQNANANFHSERGMPNIPAVESIKKMMPEANLWPVPSTMWGLHDFTSGSAQNGTAFMNQMNLYGTYTNVYDFVKVAQMVNYENHKALIEGPTIANGNAMLMWMSQSVWPSMVWQTYDFYFDTNAGYFGLKTAGQIVNALYDQYNRRITIVNNSGKQYNNLTLEVDCFDMNGQKLDEIAPYEFNLAPDQVITNPIGKSPVIAAGDSPTAINFIKTRIKDSGGNVISENFAWVTTASTRNFAALRDLPSVTLSTSYSIEKVGATNFVKAQIANFMDTPALMIRVKSLTDKTGQQILPAYYSDNYFSLMPGEMKEITIEFDDKYLLGEDPQFFVEGWNIEPMELGFGFDETYFVSGTKFVRNDTVLTSFSPGNIAFEVTVKSFANQELVLRPIVAVYNAKGAMVATVSGQEEYTLQMGQTLTISSGPVNIPQLGNLEGYTAKGFLWDEDYIPLLPASIIGGWSPGNPNLALRRPITSNSASGDAPVTNANDGVLSTYWETRGESGNKWLEVDLGFAADVDKIILNWPSSSFAQNYNIQYAVEPGSYSTAPGTSVTDGAAGARTFAFEVALKARYIRLNIVASGTTVYRLNEIEVYGAPLSTDDIKLVQPYNIITFAEQPIDVVAEIYGYYGTGVEYSATGLPAGAVFDAESGAFSWYPERSDIGVHTITFKVSNGITFDEKTFTITVKRINLAYMKATSASRSDSVDRSHEKAVDGDLDTTRWASGPSPYVDDEWWMVDLGKDEFINEVDIYWEYAYGRQYRIEASTSAAPNSFTTIATVTNGTGGVDILSFDLTVVRYVRFVGVSRGTTYGYSFWEFEVYGEDPDPEAIFISGLQEKNVTSGTAIAFTVGYIGSEGSGVAYTATNLPQGASLNASTGAFSWTPTTVGSYDITFSVSNGKFTNQKTVTLTVRARTNLALNKTVWASSEENDSGTMRYARYVVDGNRSTSGSGATRWSSNYADNEWLIVDLGAIYTISEINILWEAAYARSYRIDVATEADQFSTALSVTNNSGGNDTRTFTPVDARYVRFWGLTRATNYGFSMWQFEVY